MDDLRSEKLSQALDRAVAAGEAAPFFELLRRSSGLPGPRPNLDLARAVGHALARHEARADRLLAELVRSTDEYFHVVAAMAFAARAMPSSGARGKQKPARVAEALSDLQALCEDPRHLVRQGVIEALRMWVAAVGEPAVAALSAWTDGYFQAHVALAALADRQLLDALPRSDEVLARLDEAFVLADASPRSAERTQGMRTLRGGLPAQIAVFAARFPETLTWLSQKAASTRPETREVVASAVAGMRRTVISDVEASRLSAALEASGKPPRDPSRVVQGTRKRGRRGRA